MGIGAAGEDRTALLKADLIPDGRLKTVKGDELDHDAVAAVVTDLVANVTVPANIALFGPWGSGKSSLYALIEHRLDQRRGSGVAMIRYDAWKFGGHSLQRNFLVHVAEQLELKDRHVARIYGATETSRLRLGRFLFKNFGSLVIALLIAVACACGFALLTAWAATAWGPESTSGTNAGTGAAAAAAEATFKAELVQALPGATVVLGAVIAGLLLSNQALASAVEKRTFSPMQDADQFSAAFDRLMKAVTRPHLIKARIRRLVVFVDELDRCTPADVVTTLTDLLTFLDHHQCVFVVAADREVLEEALEQAPQAKPVRENEPYYSTSGAFLDKVFQHQLALPPTRPEALTAYAMTLANSRRGIWRDLRKDKPKYEDVVYSLVPAHIRSPRRVKVLLNNYATNVRIMAARGLDWNERAVPVAVMTVLQTEFPSVVRDLLVQPRLLDALMEDLDAPHSPDLTALVAAYRGGDGQPDPKGKDEVDASPARLLTGRPLPDSEAASIAAASENAARRRLNDQFLAYLAKIHAAEISFPTTDLIYLKPAGEAAGLDNAELSTLLDIAADTAPDTLVEEFSDASTGDTAAAIYFLTTQLGNNFGASRANLVESACRLAQTLDYETAKVTARRTVPYLLSEARQGRWRSEATSGVLLLALLDDQVADPLGPLAGSGELERLGDNGALAAVLPILPNIGDRAGLVFPHLAKEYDRRPELMHRALETLSKPQAETLWRAATRYLHAQFNPVVEDATSTPAIATTTTAAPASATEDDDPEYPLSQRYRDLLEALARRIDPAPELLADAMLFAFTDGADSALHEELLDVFDDARLGFADNTSALNRVVLAALANLAPGDEIDTWSRHLSVENADSMNHEDVLPAATTIVTNLCKAPEAESGTGADEAANFDRTALADLYEVLAPWLEAADAEAHGTPVFNALKANPPDGSETNAVLRDSLIRLLVILKTIDTDVDYPSAFIYLALDMAIDAGQATAAATPRFIKEIRTLTPQHAMALDEKIAAKPSYPTFALLRVRVAARWHAGKPTLAASNLASALAAEAQPDVSLLREWVATKPSVAQFIQLAGAIKIPAGIVRTYSETRNRPERSRIWIALEKNGYLRTALRAAGDQGVNHTVVNHMAAKIVDVKLDEQTTAVFRLVSANLATEPQARHAAQDLALRLLNSGLAGAGPNAAKIILAAGGAAPKRKPELKAAFDDYTTRHTNQRINGGELNALYDFGLLTKRKSSPIAKRLGWIFK